jgi:hypothetical protein
MSEPTRFVMLLDEARAERQSIGCSCASRSHFNSLACYSRLIVDPPVVGRETNAERFRHWPWHVAAYVARQRRRLQ